jgi:hypothetical protein
LDLFDENGKTGAELGVLKKGPGLCLTAENGKVLFDAPKRDPMGAN